MAGGRICLGQIGAPHGVRGEVRLRSFTAEPAAISAYGPLESEDGRVFTIVMLRPAKDFFVVRLSGVTNRDAAERLTNTKLYVPRERLPQPQAPDEYYHADLIGLHVVDCSGRPCGTVVAVHNFGASDVIEVRPETGDKTEMLPFNAATVPEVNIASGKLVVNSSSQAGEVGEAKPDPTKASTGKRLLARTALRSRRNQSALSRKGKE